MKKIYILLITAGLMLTALAGCSETPGSSVSTATDSSASPASLDGSDMFSDRDKEIGYEESDCIQITLNQTSAECSSDNVSISGSTVTISGEGTYLLSGSLDDGMIIVDASESEKIQLILSGADISCSTSAAIYVKQADKVFITLAADTENRLTTTDEFVAIDDNNIDAVIFSKDDLTLNGSGSLTLNASHGHGIVSKDDLVFTGGTYSITSEKHALSGKDSVRIADGTFTLSTGSDGIHAENTEDTSKGFIYIAGGTFQINASQDGLDTGSTLQIEGGSFTVTTSGGSAEADANMETMREPKQENWDFDSYANASDSDSSSSSCKGLKADGAFYIMDGKFVIDSYDDAIHSSSDIIIQDGNINIMTGDDGVHADGNVTISGGTLTVTQSYEGIEGKSIDITGGTVTVTASDDGLNATDGSTQTGEGDPGIGGGNIDENIYLSISGGTLNVNASGDGLDTNGNLLISGGEIYVSGAKDNGNGALDYDGEATITGGILAASGFSGMAQNFGSSSSQGCILVSVSTQSSETAITLRDSGGHTLISYTPPKEYNSILISCPNLTEGARYTLICGTEETAVTMDTLIYGSQSTMGGPSGSGRMQRPGQRIRNERQQNPVEE